MQYTFISKLYRYGIHLQTNCTGTVYIYKQIVHERYTFINELAEGPGIDRGKKLKKNVEKMSVSKKIQPNRSSRLAGYTQHLYECLVKLYRLYRYRIHLSASCKGTVYIYRQNVQVGYTFINKLYRYKFES